MGPKTNKLILLLSETLDFLDVYNVLLWPEWLLKSKLLLEAGKFEGITYLLGAFGGMSSFNDLLLHPTNGHNLKDNEVDAANAKLRGYQNALYELAKEIEKEASFED